MTLPLIRTALILALSATFGPWPAPAQAQSTPAPSAQKTPKVVWYHHWWSTEDWEGNRNFTQRARRDRVMSSEQRGHTKAELIYDMNGRFISEVFATQERNNYSWLTQSGVWVGDVIRVKVPGAAPGQQSTVRISAQVAFAGEGAGQTEALVCAGFIDLANCQEDYANINRRLQLPAPRNVVEIQRVNPLDLQVVMVGDEALVPLRYFMLNNVSGNPGQPEMSLRMDMTVALQLPAGATCTSRSGGAFQGRCPAERR